MENGNKQPELDFFKLLGAYCLAVICAGLIFTFYLEGHAFVTNGGFETATNNDFATKASHLVFMTLFALIIGSVFVFGVALPFFITGIFLSKKLGISNGLYFVSGGVLTSLPVCLVFVAIPNLGINMPAFEPSYSEQFFSYLPLFAFCGFGAGTVFWLYCRKKRLLPRNA